MDTSKLKKFDLQKALAGDLVVTHNGIKVVQIAHFPKSFYGQGELAVLLSGDDRVGIYDTNGKSRGIVATQLFMAPKTRELWVNLYYSNGKYDCGYPYETEQEANQRQLPNRLGNCAHKITIKDDTDAPVPKNR